MSAQDPLNGLILSLPRVVSSALAHDIEKSSVYISEQILEMKVLDGLSRVRVIVAPGTDVETVRGKVERFLDAMLAKTRTIETKTHFARSRIGGNTLVAGVNAELVQRGWVFEHGRGQVSLAGPALRLMKLLDARFADIYRHRFGAMDCMFPAMVSTKLLNRVGYFESHPNASSFVCHLVEDFDEIEAFRKANTQGACADPDRQLLASPHYCLNPAACFPCYEVYQNRVLDRGSEVLSWLGRVFRYESRNMSGLDRLWEFNVRELVFLGNDDFIFQARRDAVTMVRELAEEWNLECHIETATDAFFPTVYAARSFWQEVSDVKYEIRLAVEPAADGTPRTIAGGSINLHGPFFGERFNIKLPDGGPTSSACVGWGLERWVLALFSQHGFLPADWPEALRGIY